MVDVTDILVVFLCAFPTSVAVGLAVLAALLAESRAAASAHTQGKLAKVHPSNVEDIETFNVEQKQLLEEAENTGHTLIYCNPYVGLRAAGYRYFYKRQVMRKRKENQRKRKAEGSKRIIQKRREQRFQKRNQKHTDRVRTQSEVIRQNALSSEEVHDFEKTMRGF